MKNKLIIKWKKKTYNIPHLNSIGKKYIRGFSIGKFYLKHYYKKKKKSLFGNQTVVTGEEVTNVLTARRMFVAFENN